MAHLSDRGSHSVVVLIGRIEETAREVIDCTPIPSDPDKWGVGTTWRMPDAVVSAKAALSYCAKARRGDVAAAIQAERYLRRVQQEQLHLAGALAEAGKWVCLWRGALITGCTTRQRRMLEVIGDKQNIDKIAFIRDVWPDPPTPGAVRKELSALGLRLRRQGLPVRFSTAGKQISIVPI